MYGAIPRAINYDDFLTSMAPRPVCIGAATSDEYFPIEGVHEIVSRTRRVYDLYDARENVSLVVAEESHCSVYELGDGVFEWLCEHLGNAGYGSHPPLPSTNVRFGVLQKDASGTHTPTNEQSTT